MKESDANDKTKSQLHALSALEKIESWFNSLSDEDKMDFAKKHPAFVTPVLRN